MILSPHDCNCPLVEGGPSVSNSPICSGMALFMILLEGFIKGRCDIATPCQRVDSVEDVEPEYDFIVVGAGSAGSIVAGRLSEEDKFSVLLLEAGGPEPIGARIPSFYRTFWNNEEVDWRYRTVPDNYCLDQEGKGCSWPRGKVVLLLEAGGPEPIGARIPSFYRTFWNNEEVDWRYRTVPDNYCLDQEGKGCSWPRGKVVGGSSLLNGMMYHRGHAADYDDWVEAGAEGWSWDENKKYFDLTEGNKQIGTLVSGQHHSSSGPLPVQQFNHQPPFVYELLNAINETGLPIVSDMNDPNTPDGFMIAQTMSDDGQRVTTARAYLKPKSERPNFSLKTKAHVSKVLLDGKRAYGVEYIDEHGETKTVRANKEVILSAGALNSPHILLLSGIGPKATLDRFDIPVVEDLPVGKNLKNHVGATLYFMLTKLENTQVLDWEVLTEYLLERQGPMASSAITQLTGILYSSLADKTRSQPDIQIFFNGFYAECSKTGIVGEPLGEGDCYLEGRNISANAALQLPRSVGYLTLNSTDPRDPPLFYAEYFSHPDDMVMAKDGVRYLQRIFETDIMQNKYGIKLDPEYNKGCEDSGAEWSDSWIECMVRLHTDAQNHQLGTAAMGLVLDPELKVYNIDGLRVIDASSMPTPPTGNPQGAIMLVAERGAALIKEDWTY